MRDIKEMIGVTNDKGITLLADNGVDHNKKRRALLKCHCGKEYDSELFNYTSGRTLSCGCIRVQRSVAVNKKHGNSKTLEYKVWQGMKGRCHNPNHVDYHNYGARGITVCQEWQDSFEAFINDMGHRPTYTSTIERIDNTKGYCKDNCVWLEKAEQSKNRRLPCKKGDSPNYQVKHEYYLRKKAKEQEEVLLAGE